MERVAVSQASISRQLVRLFEAQFALQVRSREATAERIRQAILRALDKVPSLDEEALAWLVTLTGVRTSTSRVTAHLRSRSNST